MSIGSVNFHNNTQYSASSVSTEKAAPQQVETQSTPQESVSLGSSSQEPEEMGFGWKLARNVAGVVGGAGGAVVGAVGGALWRY